MISKMMKLIYILICVFVFVACDEDDHVSGEVNLKCEKNVNSDPNCYGLETHSMPLDNLDDYVSEVHGDGDVVTYHWAEGLAWFLESKKHKYGFDLDPYAMYSEDAPARGRDVYMSVEKGGKEEAWVTVYVDPSAVKIYHLHKVDKNNSIVQRDVIDVLNICSKKTDSEKCKADFPLYEGDYAVYYDTDDGEKDMERYLHILGYPKKVYKIDFVGFGDPDAADCKLDGTSNGCYTWDRVKTRFNEIMSQAVVEGDVIPKDAEYVGLDKFLTIDLTNEYNRTEDDAYPVFSAIVDQIVRSKEYGYGKELEEYNNAEYELDEACKSECEPCSEDEECLYRYSPDNYKIKGLISNLDNAKSRLESAEKNVKSKNLALGINSMRTQWCVEGRGNGLVELNNLNVFAQVLEKKVRQHLYRCFLFLKEELPKIL